MDVNHRCWLFILLLLWMMVANCKTVLLKTKRPHSEWVVSEWSKCSASCGGVKVRTVYCGSTRCQGTKPRSLEVCNYNMCRPTGIHSLYINHAELLTIEKPSSVETETPQDGEEIDSNRLRPEEQVIEPLDWTVSEWSECSANCGGGLRVRSVRCLDECGIISVQYQGCDTSKDGRPSTFEFCAQSDCTTGTTNTDILPPNGMYATPIPDGSFSDLDFTSTAVEQYQIRHNITENDGTLTLLSETVTDGMTTFSCQTRRADTDISVGDQDGKRAFFINDEFLLELDCVIKTIVGLQERVIYNGDTVTIEERNIQFPNITTFWYCDSWRCYRFNSSKTVFERSGPPSKLFTSKNVALYSIDGQINLEIENILSTVLPTMSSTQGTFTLTTSPIIMTTVMSVVSSISQIISSVSTSSVAVMTTTPTVVTPSFLTSTESMLTPSVSSILFPSPSSIPFFSPILPTPSPTILTPSSTLTSPIFLQTPVPSPSSPSMTTTMVPSSPLVPVPTETVDTVEPSNEPPTPRKTPKSRKSKRKRRPSTKSCSDSETSGTSDDSSDKTRPSTRGKKKSHPRISKIHTKITSKKKKSRSRTSKYKTEISTMRKSKYYDTEVSTRYKNKSSSRKHKHKTRHTNRHTNRRKSKTRHSTTQSRGNSEMTTHKRMLPSRTKVYHLLLRKLGRYGFTDVFYAMEDEYYHDGRKSSVECVFHGEHTQFVDRLNTFFHTQVLASCDYHKTQLFCCLYPEMVWLDCQEVENKETMESEQLSLFLIVKVIQEDGTLYLCCSEQKYYSDPT